MADIIIVREGLSALDSMYNLQEDNIPADVNIIREAFLALNSLQNNQAQDAARSDDIENQLIELMRYISSDIRNEQNRLELHRIYFTKKIERILNMRLNERAPAYSARNNMLCKVCMTESLSTLFIPCKHVVCCSGCTVNIMSNPSPEYIKCPVCRCHVDSWEKIHIS